MAETRQSPAAPAPARARRGPSDAPARDQTAAPGQSAQERERGRRAESPADVPKRGWLDILWRTKAQVAEDNLSIVAAGVAYYAFLAIVPALAAIVAVYGLVADSSQVAQHLQSLAQLVPGDVLPILEEQLTRIASNEQTASWSAALGVALAILSSTKGVRGLVQGLNITYDEREKRGFLKLNLRVILLTIASMLFIVAALGLVAVLPGILKFVGLAEASQLLLAWARWPVLLLIFMTGLAVLYRYGPSRNDAQWKWVSPGAATASGLWLAGSALFSLFVSNFGSYDKTYGSLGAVVVFLMWLYLSAYVILFGAELNAEAERQTLKDTTVGEPAPLGERDAYAADTVGKSRGEAKKSGSREKQNSEPTR